MTNIRLKLAELYELEGDSPVPQPGTGDIERLVMNRYGFLPQPLIVVVEGDEVLLSFPEESAAAQAEAKRLTERAEKFEAGFTSAAGAQGVCSVYWGTNLVGLLDERVASAGLSTYQFQLPDTYTNGVFRLGFRLDGYTATQSSLTLTNVVTGFFGITNPPALTVTGGTNNGPALVTLTGPTNFYSLLQSSTDLTNWSPVATLVNSNGVVQFSDMSATNQVRRFYRAVVP